MHSLLSERVSSGFPVSIATGMSLETLFEPTQPIYDQERIVVKLPDLSAYNLYIFNASTLLRNIIASLKYTDLVTIPKQDIYNTLLEEIELITTLFSSNNTNVVFYVHNYQYIKDVYGKTKQLRQSTTEKQHYIDSINDFCLTRLRKEDDVTQFHKDIHYGTGLTALIFTHIPFDLLSYTHFVKLDLLESNTGLIKSRKDWWTKYYPLPNKDMSFLPLFEYLLSIFGDNHMFSPAPIKERNELWGSMKARNIHPLSSEFSFGILLGKSS